MQQQLPPPDDKLKAFHQALIQEKFSVPTDFDQFQSVLQDEVKAQRFHEELVKQKFSVPTDFGLFYSALGFKKKGQAHATATLGSGQSLAPGSGGTSPAPKLNAEKQFESNVKGLITGLQQQFDIDIEPEVNRFQKQYERDIKEQQARMQREVDAGRISVEEANKQLNIYEKEAGRDYNTRIKQFQNDFAKQFGERNQPTIDKMLKLYEDRYTEQDFEENRERNPAKSFAKSMWNTFRYQIPADLIGGQLAMEKAFRDVPTKGVEALPKSVQEFLKAPELDGDNVETGVPWIDKALMSMGTPMTTEQLAERDARNRDITPQQRRRIDMMKTAFKLREEGNEANRYLVNTLEKAEDFVDYINWTGAALGQAIAQFNTAVVTRGASAYGQEIGTIYIDGVTKIADELELTPEEVINRGLDEALYPLIFGFAAGRLEYIGAKGIAKNLLGSFSKTEIMNSLRSRGLATIRGIGGSIAKESLTEGGQSVLEQIGGNMSAGDSFLESLKKIDPQDVKESVAQGAVGGGGIHSIGVGLQSAENLITRVRPKIKPKSAEVKPVFPRVEAEPDIEIPEPEQQEPDAPPAEAQPDVQQPGQATRTAPEPVVETPEEQEAVPQPEVGPADDTWNPGDAEAQPPPVPAVPRKTQPKSKPAAGQQSQVLKIRDVALQDLNVDVKRFQNRNEDFSESSVRSIVDSIKNGTFDASAFLDPIRTWNDPKDGKTYVLSGHSRTEAFREAQQLLESGQLDDKAMENLERQGITDFTKIPSIDVGNKTEAEAINIGLTGNQKASQETELEGAKLARKLRLGGKTPSEVRAELGNRANKSRLINISYLNPNGTMMQALQAVEKSEKAENKNAIIQAAEFIGEARAKFPDLTDSHENELFEYLINGAGRRYNKRSDFLEEMDRRVGDAFFNPNEPLNLMNRASIGYNESLIRVERDEIEKQLRAAERQRKIETNPSKQNELRRDIDKLNKELLRLNQELYKAREGDRAQGSLFGAPAEQTPAPAAQPEQSPPVEPQPQVSKPKITAEGKTVSQPRQRDDIDDMFDNLDKIMGQTDVSNMGAVKQSIDPKIALAGQQIVQKYIDTGKTKFNEIAQDVYNRYGEAQFRKFFPALKAGYGASLVLQDDTEGMTSFDDMKLFTADNLVSLFEAINQKQNDRSTADDLESDSADNEAQQQVGQEDVQRSGEQDRSTTGDRDQDATGTRVQTPRDSGFSDRLPPVIEQPADTAVPKQEQQPGIDERVGRGSNEGGRVGADDQGVRTEPGGEQRTPKVDQPGSAKRLSLKEKAALQEKADRVVPVRVGDIDNIRESLPVLMPHQHDNVLAAETRFFGDPKTQVEGFRVNKGIMFTDGTGTGKTLTGLGIAKRFDRMGKPKLLIVVPTDKKIKDWIHEGKFLGLEITELGGITDAKPNADKVVTTYANFRQNQALLDRSRKSPFDLVIYDEAHRIVSNQNGTTTAADIQHKLLTYSPNDTKRIVEQEFEQQIENDRKQYGSMSVALKTAMNNRYQQLLDKTKVVFLSASPFSYHKNLTYADGYLFTINQGKQEPGKAYNDFFVKNFGYRILYHKLTEPEVGVDVGVMERVFHTQLIKAGAVKSTRIEFDKDYSREFVLMDDKLGLDIDEGYKFATERKAPDGTERKYLADVIRKRFTWLYQNQLLEAIKAKHVIDRIQKHLDLGRKVIVFHGYNNNLPRHPFDLKDEQLYELDPSDARAYLQKKREIEAEIDAFNRDFPKYKDLDLSDLKNPILTIMNAFPDKTVVFNGTIPKKKRVEDMRRFNEDGSGVDIIVIQMEAGKEGVSLHDTTGKHPRVMINLGLPYKPVDAIQTEGRPYRYGLASNVPIEYPVLHYSFEKHAFGQKINGRISTAENLAFGEAGRQLGKSFKEGYNNPVITDPNPEQGVGGKQNDSAFEQMDEFERAKTYYIARGKRNAKTKAKEGIDYYATPEPLGYKLVEWLDTKQNGKLLEPSAGHGAIGRFFPDYTANKFLEPSYELRADLAINAQGDVIASRFEDHDIINKYDGIAMNPPYGTQSKTAYDHVMKALRHLRNNGRVIAIVPDGPSMDKRLEAFWGSDESNGFYQIAEIKLPSVTFERAGTSVNTKILVIDKQTDENTAKTIPPSRSIDLRSAETINELFDRIKEMTLPPRAIYQEPIEANTEAVLPKPAQTTAEIVQGKHTKFGFEIATVKLNHRVDTTEYSRINGRAKQLGGYYSSYRGGGAVPGFVFNGPDRIQKANELLDFIQNGIGEKTEEQHTNDEISAIRADEQHNRDKGKIANSEFAKRSLAPAQLMNADTGKPFQIYQVVVDLVRKYNPDSGLMQGGKYVSRGAEGTFYRASTNIAVKGLNNLSVAFHELTHAVDKRFGVVENFINATKTTDPLRKRLTELYVQYYPKARHDHPLRIRMIEGYATLIQKYLENPDSIAKQYPDLVNEFIKPGGQYYFDTIGEFLNDGNKVIAAYQQLDALNKFASRIVYDEVAKESENELPWMQRLDDRVMYEVSNHLHPLESMMKSLGISMTGEDVSNTMRMANNYLQIVNHNVNSIRYGLSFRKGLKVTKKETFLAMNEAGDWVPALDFNFHTIARRIAARGLARDWSAWLYARDVHGDYVLLDEIQAEIEDVKSLEWIENLMDTEGISEEQAGRRREQKLQNLEAEYNRVQSIVENEGVDRATAEEAYEAGKDVFSAEADMFDQLLDQDLALASHPKVQLLEPEVIERFKRKTGYSPRKRLIYNDVIGTQTDGVPQLQGSGKTKISSLMTRRGGEAPIMDPFIAAMMNHAETVRKSMKQMTYNQLFTVVSQHQDELKAGFQLIPLKTSEDPQNRYPQERDPDIIMARNGYKRVPILCDKTMKQVFDENFSYDNHHLIERAFIIGAQLFRAGTTLLFPAFALTNFLFLDQVIAFTNSRNGLIPYGSAINQLFKAFVLDPTGPERKYLEEYMVLAGYSQTSLGVDFSANSRAKDVIHGTTKTLGEQAMNVLQATINVLALPGKLSEFATRATEYILARKQGKPQNVAMEEAGRVTGPFHHHGRLGGKVAGTSIGLTALRSIPYLNASWQVLMQTGESLKTQEGRIKYGLTLGAMMASAVGSTLWILGLDDDDEQKQALRALSPEELTKYLYLPNPYGKKLIRFRIGEQFGSVTAMANMMLIESASQENYSWYDYTRAGTNFIPSQINPFQGYQAVFFGITPQLVKPSLETLLGKKTYPRVLDIENYRDRALPPELRYDKYTSPVAIRMGEALGWSPKRIDHFLEGTFGRAVKLLTGRLGPEQGFGFKDVFTRELYFEASRQVQYYYDVKTKYERKVYAMENEIKTYDQAEQDRIQEVYGLVLQIEALFDEYWQYDEAGLEPDMLNTRSLIFEAIRELERVENR